MSKALAAETANELLRTALLAELAVDLGDPRLARRAARHSASNARLLAGLDLPRHEDDDDDPDEDVALPEVDDLLSVLYPPTGEVSP